MFKPWLNSIWTRSIWSWSRPARWTRRAKPWEKIRLPMAIDSVKYNRGMSQDIDPALEGWEFKPGVVQARLVQARDGRQVLQMRVDLGVLQVEPARRPDGTRPPREASYFDY